MNCSVNSFQIEVVETDFDRARDVADFACHLDMIKDAFNPELKSLVIVCVDQLHEIAECLAGNRSGEIYAPQEEIHS